MRSVGRCTPSRAHHCYHTTMVEINGEMGVRGGRTPATHTHFAHIFPLGRAELMDKSSAAVLSSGLAS